MKIIIRNTLLVIYAIIAIAVTVCLLSYNDFKVSEFGKKSLVIVNDVALEPDFKDGDLVIANKADEIKVEDDVFFYNTKDETVTVSKAKVEAITETTETETTYTLAGGKDISGKYIIGNAGTACKIGVVGSVLGVLESKWGFLFIIVLPTLVAFVYEIIDVISQAKKGSKGKEESKDENKDKE